ncbi:hypothetical protein ABZ252_08215 [Streptomyces sp. NPDC006175]|uniref:hypothetical protein n=1 Tax=Streptomyces sp. NPDC006175 TaxID=3154471 RepID=UPI0033ADE67C
MSTDRTTSSAPPPGGPGRTDPAPPDPSPVPGDQDGAPSAQSEVTRLLSVGAHVDREFADRVIEELFDNRHRLAAPAYGYDAATVLGHALAARRLRRVRTAVSTAAALQWLLVGVLAVVAGPLGVTAFWVCTVVGLWAAWAARLIGEIVTRQITTVHLRPATRSDAGYGFDGEPPLSTTSDAEIYDEIRQEQDGSSGIVHYGGYMPFVGAGHALRAWSFAVLLDGAPLHPTALSRPDPASTPAGITPFTGPELTAYVQERLTTHLLTEVPHPDQRLDGLEVTRRLYARADGPHPPASGEDGGPRPDGPSTREPSEHYDAAREFLVVRVGSWSEELVLTVFLNFDLKGRVLHTQLHAYELLPVKAAYHAPDRLPRGVNSRVLRTLALEALLGGMGAVAAAPRALRSRRAAARRATGTVPLPDPDTDAGDLPYTDWGARHSVRQLGASSGYHHYFQRMDSTKYFKVVERRTLEVILDFLDLKHVDTTEFRARQSEVLNVGILQTGSGTIVNRGTTAVGSDASVSVTGSG